MTRVIIFLLATVLLYGFLGYRTYMSYVYEDDIVFVVKDLKNRQQQIADLNASNSKLEDDLFWYKTANDVLIEHCEPKSLTKAIKATPLPPLVTL